MANLKSTDIKGDMMYITTVKTHDRLPINLNKFAKEILKKYEHCNFRGQSGAAGAAQPADEPLPQAPLRTGRLQFSHYQDLLQRR